jgi:hypothetical protein
MFNPTIGERKLNKSFDLRSNLEALEKGESSVR